MAKWFRVWGKKRGHRRTGSKLVGRLGEALFSGSLLLLGGVSLAALIASQALVADGPYRPGFGFWVMVLVLSSFVLLGGGGLIWTLFHAGVSAERRSALARRASQIDLGGNAPSAQRKCPNIPSDANLTNSPGVRLRYRLPVVQSPAWRLLSAALFCLIWNVIATILVVLAISGHQQGSPHWFLTLFTVPFVCIGVWGIRDFLRQMLHHAGIGPTAIEVSDHPLIPGTEYGVSISQTGHLSMNVLTLNLVCEESATYQQGTDIRTERRAVFDRQLFRKTGFSIEPGIPFEQMLTLEIPKDAMHSFQSEHNAVNWRLIVRGEADAWEPFERSFPIIVHPRYGNHEATDRSLDRPESP